jgi:serine/threonine protein kinase
MGAVYAATEIETGNSVALKILLPRNTRDDLFRRRFLREAKAGSMLSGPHIVPVFGMFEDGERLCLVMERIPGGNLQQWIARHPVRDIDWIVSIGRQICCGLIQAHASGVVHRDIKPSNILLDKPGDTAFISDFGLAMLSQQAEQLTTAGRPLGTPAYMSPEQVKGLPTDHRTDLFSLGVLIHALVTGESPFMADTLAATVWNVTTLIPTPLDKVDSRVPRHLARTVDRLLCKDPKERFDSAEEVERALAGELALDLTHTQILSNAPAGWELLSTRQDRKPGLLRGMIGLIVAGSLGLVLLVVFRPPRGQTDVVPPVAPLLSPGDSSPREPVPEASPPMGRKWTVATGGEADFHTLKDALDQAGPGDEIQVLDDAVHEGPFTINEPVRLRGVRLIATRGAKLRAPNPRGRLATLSIVGTRDVVVQGFDLEGGVEHHALYLAGDVAGGLLLNNSLHQSEESGWAAIMVARECRGTPESPLIIRLCYIHAAKFGVYVGREDTLDAVEADHLHLDGNEFSGSATHVRLTHAVGTCRITHNVFRGGEGLSLRLLSAPGQGPIELGNNTFLGCKFWLDPETAGSVTRGEAAANLILASEEPAWGPAFEALSGNWTFTHNVFEDPDLNSSEELFSAGLRMREVSIASRDPADPRFLRPMAGSRVATFAVGNRIPEYIGARAPLEP